MATFSVRFLAAGCRTRTRKRFASDRSATATARAGRLVPARAFGVSERGILAVAA